MKNNIENRIEDYYKNEVNNIPQFTDNEKENLKNKILKNKQNRKVFVRKRFAIISAILIVILIPSILIPALTIGPEDNTKYYSDTDVVQQELTVDFVQSYIGENYNKYSFIFDECEVTYSYGIYSAENQEELLSINVELFMYEPPFATIKFDIIINKGLDLRKYNVIKSEGEKYKTEEYTRYRKDNVEMHQIKRRELIEYVDYNIFLDIDQDDDDAFNKFY